MLFSEYVDDDGIRWTLEKNRSPVTLMGFYNISWKPRNNHFQRYTDVKQKGEMKGIPIRILYPVDTPQVESTQNWNILPLFAKLDHLSREFSSLDPVVQSIVSLTSSLGVISLPVLEDSIYNILIFFAEKMWVVQKLHFFSKKFQNICVSLDVNFNEWLTNDIVSFEQLGPGVYEFLLKGKIRKTKMLSLGANSFP